MTQPHHGSPTRRRLHSVVRVLAVAACTAACGLAPLILPSCHEPPAPDADPNDPTNPAAGLHSSGSHLAHRQGEPTVRVLLSAASAPSARIATSGAYHLFADGQLVAASDDSLPVVEVSRHAGTWQVGTSRYTATELRLEPVGQSYLQFGRTMYRGSFRFIPSGPSAFQLINHVPLEQYLLGVLPCELYRDWSLETYRALAVAARTFALYHVDRRAGYPYDLGAGTGSQVYGGLTAETQTSLQAVRTTYGQVLTVGGEGEEEIFLAQYSSCCGGIVNGARVIRTAPALPPLQGGQACEHCAASPHFRWPALRVPKATLYQVLRARYPAAASLGGLQTIRVVEQTTYGRAVWVDAVGTRVGSHLRLRAEDIRLALLKVRPDIGRKLYSMNCQIRDLGPEIEFAGGRGHGHGVGLCQYGAEGKARAGWSAHQILAFYYPGSRIMRAY